MNRFGHRISLLAMGSLLGIVACSGATDSARAPDTPKPREEQRADPTANRTPAISKSLTLSPDWQPPAPTRTIA